MKKWEILKLTAIIAGVYLFLEYFLDITCPILYLTGISCAGCGMSRAWIRLLHLDFAGAFYYHPLFWIPAVAVILVPFWKKIPKKVKNALITVACVLFIGVYIGRLIDTTDTIVVFQPQHGLIYRVFSYFFHKL